MIKIDASEMAEAAKQFAKLSKVLDKSIWGWLDQIGSDSRRSIQLTIKNAPRVDLGQLVGGLNYDVSKTSNGAQVIIKPDAAGDKHAIFVEEDTRPHMPPASAVQGWADRHGIPVWAVQQSIAEKGTKGIYMFEQEFQHLLGNFGAIANELQKQIIVNLEWAR